MRLRGILALLLIGLSLASCARHAPRYAAATQSVSELDARMYGAAQPASEVVRQASQAVTVAQTLDNAPYTLDSGDRLRVVVFGQDALSNNYTIDADGRVSLPLIGGVKARGLTTAQLSGAIAARLKQSFVRDPSVAVEIETYRPFFALGEVTYPGQYPYVPNMTVENAVAIAGGFTPRAYKDHVTVTRKVDGVPTRHSLPLSDPIRPGDTIDVAERWF